MVEQRIVPCLWLDDQVEAARERVFHALVPMRRLDVAALARAFRAP